MWTSVYTRRSYIRMSVCICGTTWWWRRRCIYTHVYVDVYINAYMHMCSMYECWSADANLSAHLQVHVYVQLYLFSYVYLHRYLRLPSYTCSDEFTCIHDVHECIHTHISGVSMPGNSHLLHRTTRASQIWGMLGHYAKEISWFRHIDCERDPYWMPKSWLG